MEISDPVESDKYNRSLYLWDLMITSSSRRALLAHSGVGVGEERRRSILLLHLTTGA